MKRKKITKIILSALILGAFCFSSLVIPYAKEEVFSNNNDYLFLTLTQFDPNGVADSLSWTYNGAESSTVADTFGISSYPDLGYYPCYTQAWSGFTVQDRETLTRGQILLMKQFGTDTFDVLQPGIYINSITCVCTIGYQSGFTVNLPSDFPFYESNLLFNGKALDKSLYTLSKGQTALRTYTNPEHPMLSYQFRNHRFTYTFNTPLLVEDYDHWNFGSGVDFRFDGYGVNGLYILFGHSGFLINYSTAEEYETGSLSSNSVLVGDFKAQAEDFKDKLNVQKPTNEQVADIIEIAQNNTPQGITQYFDFFDNNSLSADFKRLMLTMMLTSLGIAFCGYALHGKRG